MSLYYRSYARHARANSKTPSKAIAEFNIENMSKLSLGDLRKIKKAIEAYRSAAGVIASYNNDVRQKNSQYMELNKKIRQKNKQKEEEFEASYLRPYQDKFSVLSKRLSEISVGLLKSVWVDTFTFNGWRLPKTPEATSLVAEYRHLDAGWDEQVWQKKPNGECQTPELKEKPAPKKYANLIFGGAKVRVMLEDIDIGRVDALIVLAEAQLEKGKSRVRQLQARAAANELETRALARNYRDFAKQTALLQFCPYCRERLTEKNAQLDHIYPVSKGGKSMLENLVFVCSPCNIKKSNMTLTSFARSTGLNLVRVHENLALLSKEY